MGINGRETKLRKMRKAAGLKQVELAALSGVSVGRVCYYEVGYFLPTLPTARKLAKALGCRVSDLFDAQKLKPRG